MSSISSALKKDADTLFGWQKKPLRNGPEGSRYKPWSIHFIAQRAIENLRTDDSPSLTS